MFSHKVVTVCSSGLPTKEATATRASYQASCSSSENGVITMKLYLTHGATSSGVLGINAAGSTTVETEPWLQTNADKEAASRFLQGLIKDMKNSRMGFSVQDLASVTDLMAKKTSGDHYVGTAEMGMDDGRKNGTSVVDTNAKVYGTESLVMSLLALVYRKPLIRGQYIVDASIHPDLPTGNTQAIVMIAAEAAIEKILGQAGGGPGSVTPSASMSASPQPTKIAEVTTAVASTGTGFESTPTPPSGSKSIVLPVPAPSNAEPNTAPSASSSSSGPAAVKPSGVAATGSPVPTASTVYMTATATSVVATTHSNIATVTVTAGALDG